MNDFYFGFLCLNACVLCGPLLIQCLFLYIGPNSDLFTIKMHHGGEFVKRFLFLQNTRLTKYHFFYYCDFDKICLLELNAMAGELGYCGAMNNYFSVDLGRFVLIENDETVLLLKHLLN